MPRKYSRRRRSSKKAKKSTKRRYQGAWSGWLKELALESDNVERPAGDQRQDPPTVLHYLVGSPSPPRDS